MKNSAGDVAVSSRGQDTWFSATGPGFDSPYRYHSVIYFSSTTAPRERGFFLGNAAGFPPVPRLAPLVPSAYNHPTASTLRLGFPGMTNFF